MKWGKYHEKYEYVRMKIADTGKLLCIDLIFERDCAI